MTKVKWTRGDNAWGTSLIGKITVPYARLAEIFGEPDPGDGYKTDAEWTLTLPGNIVATIYNWKDGRAYCGAHGTDVEDIHDWHVGAHGKREALWLVQQIIGGR
jgi:hypothetical protein